MSTTSSHWPNLRPTSRSTPTSSNPHRTVESDRRRVAADDAGDHRVEAVVAGQVDEVREQRGADPGALRVTPHVHAVLDRRRVRRPGPVRRHRREPDHRVRRRPRRSPGARHECASIQASCSVVAAGHEVEGDGRLEHLGVVDARGSRRRRSAATSLISGTHHCSSNVAGRWRPAAARYSCRASPP